MTHPKTPSLSVRVLLLSFALVVASCSSSDADSSSESTPNTASKNDLDTISVSVVSSPPQFVSGGDMVVELVPAVEDSTSLSATAGEGTDVSAKILGDSSDGTYVLTSGFPTGEYTIEFSTGDATGSIDITSFGNEEPVFSGPHSKLATCTTERFELGAPQDDNCYAESVVSVAEVEGLEAISARTEVGVINRSIYTITTPQPSSVDGDGPDMSMWNGRLIYRFGGGCGTTYSQGFDMTGDVDAELLELGYAVATSTLNTFQVQCNAVLSAETAMRVKEHFTETLGVPELTIGEGGSGGAIQQIFIAQNYPGILDAIGPTAPFPDAVTISGGVVDCALLNNYYSGAGSDLHNEQKVAINGHLTSRTCDMWEQTFVPGIDPTACGFGDAINGLAGALPGLEEGIPVPPEEDLYDPENNVEGLRCTLQDSNINIFGENPETGFANRPWDNVGIQYGLSALNLGELEFDQFVDLNENIGSFDIDGQPQESRADAPISAIEAAYSSGHVITGVGGLGEIPIIIVNIYTDDQGDIHDRWRTFSIAERMGGTGPDQAPNLGLWTVDLPTGESIVDSMTGSVDIGTKLITALDEWATQLSEVSDPSDDDVLSARPNVAQNSCYDSDGSLIAEGSDVYEEGGECTTHPIKGDPRTVAGADLKSDIMKCELVSIDDAVAMSLYEGYGSLSGDEISELERVFPDGVCDWSKPGLGRTDFGGLWQSYAK